uniref:Rho family GTPase 1a n=1 Tax=Callorhinchus milii TaxID=7868 RepID=A0A4W3GIU5_CALMI
HMEGKKTQKLNEKDLYCLILLFIIMYLLLLIYYYRRIVAVCKRLCLWLQTYVPTVFENYTASVEVEELRVELSLWDTSGSPYYDNVRPLCYSDSDAVLVCFDVSRPETLDSAIKKWKTEIQDYCPTTKTLLVGCKNDLRTDYSTVLELSSQKQAPISHEQVTASGTFYFRYLLGFHGCFARTSRWPTRYPVTTLQ